MLMDVDAAVVLFDELHRTSQRLDDDRAALAPRLADAETILGPLTADPQSALAAASELLLEVADDLDNRLRIIAVGGPVINEALWTLETLRDEWATIDNQGGTAGSRDGIVSDTDLTWAATHLSGDARSAAAWLLGHPDIFRAIETAGASSDYLRAEDGPWTRGSGGDGKVSLVDIDAWLRQLDTYATLLPYMAAIDTAAHGGNLDGVLSKADFEAFLDHASLPPDVRVAAQAALDDSAFHDTDNGFITWDNVLLIGSMLPVVGDIIDGAMALYYVSQGRWTEATMSGIGLVPVPGVSGGSMRAATEAVEEVAETQITREMRETALRWADGPSTPRSPADADMLRRGLASEAQLGDPHRVIAGGGAAREVDAAERLVAHYGGESGDWLKLSSPKYEDPAGFDFEIHFYMRHGDDTLYEPKTKFPSGSPWTSD